MNRNDDPSDSSDRTFESLSLPHKEVPHLVGTRYRVYSDSKNYTLVEAGSALEAIQASGMKNVHKVLRDTIMLNTLLDVATVTGSATPPMPQVSKSMADNAENTAQGEEGAGSIAAAAAAAADAKALSNDEVDKLLEKQ